MEKFGRETKEYMLNELKVLFEKNPNVFVTAFSNLKVTELQKLRVSLRGISSRYTVVKNSIARGTLKALRRDDIMGMIDGMCGVVFLGGDVIAASRILVDFKKEHEGLDIKGGFLEGSIISFDKIKELSALPSRKILIGMAVFGMYSPVSGFVRSLGGLIQKFVYVVNAVKEKRG